MTNTLEQPTTTPDADSATPNPERRSLTRGEAYERLVERAREAKRIQDTPPTVDSFNSGLDAIAEIGAGYDNKNDFDPFVQSLPETGETPLSGYQVDVYSYVQSENWRDVYAAEVDLDAFQGISSEAKAANLNAMITDVAAKLGEATDPKDKQLLESYLKSLNNYMEADALGMGESLGDEVKQYLALAMNENADPDDVVEARVALLNLRDFNYLEGGAYGIASMYHPAGSGEANDVPLTAEQQAAKDELASIRDEVSIRDAKREKRLWGGDAWRGDAIYSHKHKALDLSYKKALFKAFGHENENFLENGELSNRGKIESVISYIASEAGTLDEDILTNYKEKDSLLGKAINWYGRRKTITKVGLGLAASAVAGALTGGYGTFAVSGTSMAMTFEAKARQKRAAGADMLSFNVQELTRYYEEQGFDLDGENAEEDFANLFESVFNETTKAREERIEKAQNRRTKRVMGSYAAGAAIGTVMHVIPGGYFDGLHGHGDAAAAHTTVTPPEMSDIHVTQEPAKWFADGAANVDPTQHLPGNIEIPANIPAIHEGSGFFDWTREAFGHSITPQQLMDAAPKLIDAGYAYPTPDGMIGMVSPGAMPADELKILVSAMMK